MEPAASIAFIVAAYLLGGLPSGVVLGRMLKGIDVRRHGSGATGATNSLRVLGWPISLTVLVVDFCKGLVPVLAARWIGLPDWAVGLVAVAAVLGHCFSPYIGFRGGKGVATGGGAAIAMFPWLGLLVVLVVAIVLLTRYVSLASLAAAATGALVVVGAAAWGTLPAWWSAAIVAMAILIVIQHRSNIHRLLHGSERKFGVSESPHANSA